MNLAAARGAFSSLTTRLVLTAVALVALVGILVSVVTAVALHSSLMSRLDDDVESITRSQFRGGAPDTNNRGPGTLLVYLAPGTDRGAISDTGAAAPTTSAAGGVVGATPEQILPISDEAVRALEGVSTDARPRTIDLDGYGDYRVIAQSGYLGGTPAIRVTGLPESDLHATMRNLVGWEALLTLLGVVLAAGGGTLLVRRQLRPLREVAATAHAVAALPLASGAVDLTDRVPGRLTDPGTEVGQVGAALNTLLAHVGASLAARHRSEQQVRQFVADASHELRTPLTTIRGYTELARTRPGDADTTATALAKVQEESARMTGLVEDLLLLARLDAGRPLEREPIDLSRLLVEAVADAQVVAPDHQWRLDLGTADEADGVPPVEVVGDEQRLHQVITNLLTNARKHTPAGTSVTVALVRRPGLAGFRVHDDGPGFPPELVDHAFERFTRGDASRQREGGAGLGLSLVEAIVSSLGGRVSLASRPGDTTIEVTLPAGGE